MCTIILTRLLIPGQNPRQLSLVYNGRSFNYGPEVLQGAFCDCHFPIGILGQVWCLIVSISDLCPLSYFDNISFRKAEFWAHPVGTARLHCQGHFGIPIEIWRYVSGGMFLEVCFWRYDSGGMFLEIFSVKEMGNGTRTRVRKLSEFGTVPVSFSRKS